MNAGYGVATLPLPEIPGETPMTLLITSTILALTACDGSILPDDSGTTDDSGLDTDHHYEEGCHTVDGARGFAWLTDALKVADEGSEIMLCPGGFEEKVTIDRSVTLVGSDDPTDPTTWIAPVNELAAEITGATSVTLRGFSVESTRSGFSVESAANITFDDVHFTSIAGTAIAAEDTEDLVVTGCSFTAPEFGAVEVDGGSASIEDSAITGALGFGVKAQGQAEVSVSDCTISETSYTELTPDGGIDDGFAFWGIEEATLVSTNNTYTDNLGTLWAEEADLDSSGDTVAGGTYGMYCGYGACIVEGGAFIDNLGYGIIAVNQGDTVSIANTLISGDPEVVLDDPENGLSVGLWVQADGTAELTDVTITGHNGTGALITPFNGDLDVLIDGLTMDDNGRRGLSLSEVSATLIDVNVDNLREVDDGVIYYDDGSALIQHGFAVSVFGGSYVSWTGGGARDSELINVVNLQSTLVMDGVELAGGTYFGAWNIEGDLTFKNGVVTDAPFRGGIMSQYGASVTVQDSEFVDSHQDYTWGYSGTDGNGEEYVYEYVYHDYSTDISSIYDGPIEVSGNTFTNGSNGIEIIGNTSDAVVEDNAWSDYNRNAVYVSSQNTSNPVEITNNTFEDVGAYAIYCSYGAARIQDASIDKVHGYRNAATVYLNGEYNYDWDYDTYAAALYSYACDLELDTVAVTDSIEHGVQLRNSNLVVLDLTVGAGSEQGSSTEGSVYFDFTYGTPDLLASGVTVTGNAAGAGVLVRGSSSYPGGTVSLSNVTVADSSGDGLVVESLYDTDVSLEDVTVTDSAYDGISSSYTDLSLTNAVVSANTDNGITMYGTEGSPVEVTFEGLTVRGNSGQGLLLQDAIATLTDAATTANTGYGIRCEDSVTLYGCDTTDLSANGDGPHCGCHESCTELPGPLCEDTPPDDPVDTGDTATDTAVDTASDTAFVPTPDTGP